ncbi:hypothetical protein N7481_005597 [Penicillium waksmanii]|uniref:uncharacterized protein n=1 Tax=Penicillium waksmanii TaxID=69791 RepID=UPI002546696E|nr:uncharacterized protein N7481_005597 [Penicillium waksmanii]KAJ5983498.1 hypothetical protein N7481_005597 [Penicillium waksmanii]
MAFRQRQSRGPCDDDPEAGPGPSTARFYSRSDTAPHVSDAYNSTSTSPDDDARTLYSDEELIVTADTYPTPNDDHQVPDVQPVEEELASHIAMFLPSGSSQDDSVPQTRNGRIPGQRREGFRWCNEFVTDGLYKPYSHPEGELSVEMATLPPTRRRAISLDTFDGSAATPQWPGNVPAVRVHQPPFPPPTRIPTPPGVPSFGTPEAMAASAQFTRGPSPPTTNSWRGNSPNGAIRRLFGLQSPSQLIPTATATAATAIQSIRGIGRAPDGTRVLGGFGPRQSGHGMDFAQGLYDHTFHVDNIPLAATQAATDEPGPAESRRTSVGTAAETSSFKSTLSLPKRYARLFRPSIAEMFASTSPEPGSSPARSSLRSSSRSPSRDPTGDSTQDPVAMIAPPRNPARIRDQRRQFQGQGSPSDSFQRHTVVNQTIQEEELDTEPVPVPQLNAAYKILSRIPMPLLLCCCFRGRIVDVINQGISPGANQGTDQGTPLGPITSRDSYTTAPSRSSPVRTEGPQRHEGTGIPEQPERRVWTMAANFVHRGVAVLKQRMP